MPRTFQYRLGEDEHTVQVEEDGGQHRVRVGEHIFTISAHAGEAGRLDLCVDGRRLRAYVAPQGDLTHIWLNGVVWTLARPDPRRRTQRHELGGALEAAMPGRVLDVLVAEGDIVTRGDTLVLLEAMKMELRIQAAGDGIVSKVRVQPGQVVERGQRLVEMERNAR
jgi:acetyl/propionyl-CoA carboxylase alpha subunit